MKTAAIVIEQWKLDVFAKHLTNAGYSYEKCAGLRPNLYTLKVKFEWVADLQPVVKAAQAECALMGKL